MVWKKWTELKSDDRLELIRSEVSLTSAVNNMNIFLIFTVVSIFAPFTIFTIWIPAGLFLLAVFTAVGRWKENERVVADLRGSSLEGLKEKADEEKTQ